MTTPGEPPPAPFVVGVGRSGTTLLRLMLDAHPDLAIPGESHLVPALLEVVAGAGDREAALQFLAGVQTWPNFALELSAVARAFAAEEPFTPAGAVRALFRLYAERFGKPRWGDKTPTYRQAVAAIAAALPEAHIIHMIRDGRDAALSYRGLWFGPGDDLEDQARFWTAEISETRRQAVAVPHYLELHYEDLVREPERELRRLCDFLQLPFHPAMLSYGERSAGRLAEYVQTFGPDGPGSVPHDRFLAIHDRTRGAPDPGRIGRWRTEMSGEERRRYQAIAGPLLQELGYPLED